MKTSVYLSNHRVQIAVGEAKKNKIRIQNFVQFDIREGSLINGVITSEEGLKSQLSKAWESHGISKKISLVIDSTQIAAKIMTVPKMNKKKTLEVVKKELSSLENPEKYIYDYRVCSMDKKSGMATVLGAAIQESMLKSYLDVFASMGVEVESVDIALNAQLKSFERIKDLENETFIFSKLDGEILISTLFVQGSYKYLNRTRIFAEHGTDGIAAEVGNTISSMIQFLATEQKGEKIKSIYLGGFPEEDQRVLMTPLRELGLEAARPFRLTGYEMPDAKEFYDFIFAIGALISEKGQDINFAQKISDREENKKSFKIYPGIFAAAGALVLCIAVSGVIFAMNMMSSTKISDMDTYIEDADNQADYTNAQNLDLELANKKTGKEQLAVVKQVLESYPQANTRVEKSVKNSAGTKVSITVDRYDSATGMYEFVAMAPKVTSIYDFIKQLKKSELFADLKYSGYNYTEETKQYDIHISTYLSENAGK